jgi:F-type H+-transporting ATPase subunit b
MLLATLAAASESASESPITIDVDSTSLVILGLFVGLTLVLKPLLFDPMLALFAKREDRIDGRKKAARELDEKSATALATYEKEIAASRAKAQAEREKIRAEGARQEQEILGKARAASTDALENGKRQIAEEAARVRSTLKADTSRMAADLAARVLGRGVQS